MPLNEVKRVKNPIM